MNSKTALPVGDDYPCFITFEAGPTHDGIESAKRLVAYAAAAGANAVKFQIFDPDRLVADKSLQYSYTILSNKDTGRTEEVTESLHAIFVRRALSDSEWLELKRYSDELGLMFFATIGDEQGLALAQSMDCHSLKIASADVNHLPLLRMVAATGMAIQLDTGNATFGEIETAIDVIRSERDVDVIIHNCPSGYPARLDSINLRMLPALKQTFRCPVAYSDHSPGCEMDIAAVALGANLVEKTITEDRCTRSVEHIMSLEPDEMKTFVQTIRDVEVAMGSSRRILSQEEKKQRLNVRRSAYLAEEVKAGDGVADAAVHFKRPGFGIPPDVFESLGDMLFAKDLPAGHQLRLCDLE